jgi:hypothetical protein
MTKLLDALYEITPEMLAFQAKITQEGPDDP